MLLTLLIKTIVIATWKDEKERKDGNPNFYNNTNGFIAYKLQTTLAPTRRARRDSHTHTYTLSYLSKMQGLTYLEVVICTRSLRTFQRRCLVPFGSPEKTLYVGVAIW